MNATIGVIDVGIGNTRALSRALEDVGAQVVLVNKPGPISYLDGIVLPGVGAFDTGIEALKDAGLWDLIINLVRNENLNLLGICLGMQLLAEESEEGKKQGLGFIPGQVKHLSTLIDLPENFSIPKMGWAKVTLNDEARVKNLQSLEKNSRYYFVHSYYFQPSDPHHALMYASEYANLVVAVKFRNVCGFQFHPEKSHKFGLRALSWWIDNLS